MSRREDLATVPGPGYRWVALSNTTLGTLMVTINGSITLIALPDTILTDAFPSDKRGLALGLNQVAGIAGQFIGLILGGLLGPVEWHLVFIVSVPFGVFGTFWAYLKLREMSERRPVNLDWWGNAAFAVGLTALLAGITYGIQPYGGHTMGWENPWVLAAIGGGAAVLAGFCVVETRVTHPMFRISLFRIRAFTAGNLASLLIALGRGGLMFILIIWLQGIYLPQHGYSFDKTPLWAGIYMLPLTAGFLSAGPLSGWLSDKFGARVFSTGGAVITAVSFLLLQLLPVNFTYWQFALILLLSGIGQGLFSSPNRAAIMNSLPAERRGVGSGMTATFQNSATVLSIGIFFTLIILGLSSSLPSLLSHGLTAQGVPAAPAAKVAALPPVSVMFAALLGYNPVQTLLGPVLAHLPASHAAYLAGRSFFPSLITPAFASGLSVAFDFAIAACLVAAVASVLRGGKYIHQEEPDKLWVKPTRGASMATTYDFTATAADGKKVPLSEYRGNVLLVVNLASKCGLTPQYEGLEALYRDDKDRGLEILGFPSNQFLEQEPGTDEEIQDFCKTTYDVTFPVFRKIDVNGPGADPLYEYLRAQAPGDFGPQYGDFYDAISKIKPDARPDDVKWNFTKFLIGRDGEVIKRYEPPVPPADIKADLENYL